MKKVTIGIPAYKAHDHICNALASIQIQTFKDIKVVIATDLPEEDYSFVKDRFPDLDITILPCKENTGPGLARQRALDACQTDWITFIDADDVLMSPLAIEDLYRGCVADDSIIECQGAFYEELMEPQDGVRIILHNEPTQPWVFGRMYNVQFLRDHNIRFSDLRAMEDGEFNWKIRLTIADTDKAINQIDKPIYFWRTGSEHSITRVKMKDSDIPQYTFDLGQLGTVEAAIRAINFIKETDPDKPILKDFILDIMLGLYFSFEECRERAPRFEGINFWNMQRFYYEEYKAIETSIPAQKLKDAYSTKNISRGRNMIGVIPHYGFRALMDILSSTEYGGEEDLKKIEDMLPQEAIDNRKKTGVIG